jgi:plastocyanin
MRRSLLAGMAAAAATALAPPAAAQADQVISMPGKYFSPSRLTVLAGEPVTWRNDDVITHDVAALGAFVSGPLAGHASYGHAFPAPGEYTFRCTIHPFMTGAVSVAAVILQAPDGPVLAGDGVQLTGRAPVGTPRVGIERSVDGGPWEDTGVAGVPDGQGAYSVLVPAAEGASFRAVVAAGTSAVVTPPVAARVSVALHVARGKHRTTVHVRTRPAGARLFATLQTYRRWHFTWHRRGRAVRLDARGRAAFRVPSSLRTRARVILTAKRGGTPLVTSGAVRLPDGRHVGSPLPPVRGEHEMPDPPAAEDGGAHGGH